MKNDATLDDGRPGNVASSTGISSVAPINNIAQPVETVNNEGGNQNGQATGKQTVAPIVIDGYGKNNNIVIDSNAITSLYGKNTALDQLYQAVQDEANGKFALLYANKKEAVSLLQRAGHKLSGTLMPRDGFYHSIRENGSPVKPKFGSVTETQQFKRWFGDWQKHPGTASKIVNADGTPDYHIA